MKLLALPTSPFTARVLIQAFEKGLDLQVAYPDADTDWDTLANLNPFGKTPVLVVEGGFVIESGAIQEYLEDVHAVPALRPRTPLQKARMRAFVRAVDHYLFPEILVLRALEGEQPELPAEMASLDRVLGALTQLMDGRAYACGDHLSLADCALVPACFFLEHFLARLGWTSIFPGRPRLGQWWETVSGHDSVNRVIGGLAAAVGQAS